MAYLTKKNWLTHFTATILFFSILLLTTSCSSNKEKDEEYTIGHVSDTPPIHVYIITATSKDDIKALNEAANVAVRLCATTNERAEVLENHAQYQGMTDKQKNIVEQANTALNKSNGTFSELDYKVIIRFRCLPRDHEKSLVKIANQLAGDQIIK